jgi:predicted CXXCH cytochrome family protein
MIRQLLARHHGMWLVLLAIGFAGIVHPGGSQADSRSASVAHDQAACNLCHFASGDGAEYTGLNRDTQCRNCHLLDKARGVEELAFHGGKKQDCARCHSFHSTDELKVPGGRASLIALHEAGTGHCRSCHGTAGRLGELSDAHRIAANLYHGDLASLANRSPSEGCLLCHSAESKSPWKNVLPEATKTFNRHTTHPLGIPNRATRAANAFLVRLDPDKKLPLYQNRIECQTCHLITARNEDLLVSFPEKQDLCLGCHRRNGVERSSSSVLTATMTGP